MGYKPYPLAPVLREIYAENPTALHEIRSAELHHEYVVALESGDKDKQAQLLQEAQEQFPQLYDWLSY